MKEDQLKQLRLIQDEIQTRLTDEPTDAEAITEQAIVTDLLQLKEVKLSSLLSDLKDDPKAYSYSLDDLEVFLEKYDLGLA